MDGARRRQPFGGIGLAAWRTVFPRRQTGATRCSAARVDARGRQAARPCRGVAPHDQRRLGFVRCDRHRADARAGGGIGECRRRPGASVCMGSNRRSRRDHPHSALATSAPYATSGWAGQLFSGGTRSVRAALHRVGPWLLATRRRRIQHRGQHAYRTRTRARRRRVRLGRAALGQRRGARYHHGSHAHLVRCTPRRAASALISHPGVVGLARGAGRSSSGNRSRARDGRRVDRMRIRRARSVLGRIGR